MNAAAEDPAIGPTSYVTLHYRLALADGHDLVNTFDHRPATFQLGAGQLGEPLERCLQGLRAGERRTFDLAADAFGPRLPNLVRRVRRGDIPSSLNVTVGERLDLRRPNGQPFAATVVAVGSEGEGGPDDDVTLDFNHPLAGRALVFEVAVIGVL